MSAGSTPLGGGSPPGGPGEGAREVGPAREVAPRAASRAPGSRDLALDVLRGVAVLLVVFRHLGPPPPGTWAPAQLALGFLAQVGWVGVDAFFVLSGYLVGGLVLRELRATGRFDAGRFFVRRGLKIYPGFYVFLALTVTLGLHRHADGITSNQLLAEVVFLQNYQLGAVHDHSWTLAVEEHFYAGLIAFGWWCGRRGGAAPFAAAPAAAALLAATCLAGRIQAAGFGLGWQVASLPTHLRLDSLACGVALAWWLQTDPVAARAFVARRRSLLRVAPFVLLIPTSTLPHQHPLVLTLGLTGNWLAFSAVLLLVASPTAGSRPGRLGRAMAWIGRDSYSIYLWHLPVIIALGPPLERLAPASYPIRAAALVVATVLLGVAAARLVERPFLRWRDRRFPARTPPRDPAGSDTPTAAGAPS